MINESTGQYHSYSNKPAVIHSEFAIPEGSPKWVRGAIGVAGRSAFAKILVAGRAS
ncbi:hypothetical protein [Brucella pseudogrignonensis]|uniref:hypothetical protein n=1 Tax=Brucella pseudogrignonensis TaxID=419475 RepID=UPI0038D21A94